MTTSNFYNIFLKRLSIWKGVQISEHEDFDMICDCQIDYIEILLIGEHEFSINLLENTLTKDDFSTVGNFLKWAFTNFDNKTTIKYEINFYHPLPLFSKSPLFPIGDMVA